MTRRKVLGELRRQFNALPRDEYPTLVALADALTDDLQEALCQFAIDLPLRGIRALAKR